MGQDYLVNLLKVNTRSINLIAAALFTTIAILCCVLQTTAVYAQATSSTQTIIPVANTSTLNPDEIALLQNFGPWPQDLPHDPGNELSGEPWAEQLGELLFNDPGLSASGKHSCAGCHLANKGFADGLKLAQGIEQHERNTQGLFDLATQRWFGWDGGADSLWAATLRPLLSDIEMGADISTLADNYRRKAFVENAFKVAETEFDLQAMDDEAFVVLLSKAIAAYVRTLTSEKTTFDHFLQALNDNDTASIESYPTAAKRGLKLFIGEANCHVCHFGPNFSNGEFHDTGRPFFTGVGKVDSGRYGGIKRVRADKFNLLGKYNSSSAEQHERKTRTVTLGQVNFGQWRTPTLRNLSLTAPYMHDGSLETLRAVVDSYADIDPDRLHGDGEAILKPLNISDTARNDLVLFLQTLSEPLKQ